MVKQARPPVGRQQIAVTGAAALHRVHIWSSQCLLAAILHRFFQGGLTSQGCSSRRHSSEPACGRADRPHTSMGFASGGSLRDLTPQTEPAPLAA